MEKQQFHWWCDSAGPVLRAHDAVEALVGHQAGYELARLALVVVALHAPLHVLQDVKVPGRSSNNMSLGVQYPGGVKARVASGRIANM